MPALLPSNVLTVSQATQSIKSLLEESYRFIHVQGEVSNLRTPYSGHRYFILKDNTAQLRAVLFKTQERYLDKPLEDGQQIICHGRISVYEQRGEYQLIVDTVEHVGSGALQIRFEELKRKLAAEGFFETARKRVLPSFPEKIVVISSPTGAAIHDFWTVWHLRRSNITVQLFPVRVQGKNAGEEIAAALDRVNRQIGADLIVLCRGGGSIEDLWAFNEECVARAIVRSKIPVVTGIGHEIDFTIADFCADLRAPTPTGAAERIIPDTVALRNRISSMRKEIEAVMLRRLAGEQRNLEHNLRLLGKYREGLDSLALKLDLCIHRFSRTFLAGLGENERKLSRIMARFELHSPLHQVRLSAMRLDSLKKRLVQHIHTLLERKEARLSANAALLDSMSPLATLARGYAIVRKEDVKTATWSIISKGGEVKSGERIDVLLGEGSLDCQVLAVRQADHRKFLKSLSVNGDAAGE
jgi:exodeoxyribonuclease VII large subunit